MTPRYATSSQFPRKKRLLPIGSSHEPVSQSRLMSKEITHSNHQPGVISSPYLLETVESTVDPNSPQVKCGEGRWGGKKNGERAGEADVRGK